MTAAPPIDVPSFEHDRAQARAREIGAAGESVVAAAQDDCVVVVRHPGSSSLAVAQTRCAKLYWPCLFVNEKTGDTFGFPTTLAHRYRNPESEEAEVIGAIALPSY